MDLLSSDLKSTSELAFDPQRVASLKGAAKAGDDAALRKVAQEFESLLMNLVMKSMRDANFGGGLFDSQEGQVFQGMLDQQYAQSISKGRGMGLADMIVQQVKQLESMGIKKPLEPAVKG